MHFDRETTSLIIIDMLNDFVRENGSLVVPKAKSLIPNQKMLLDTFNRLDMPVLYLTDNHQPDDDEFEQWPPHAVIGTWGSKVIDELKPDSETQVIRKRRYSGFFGTDLDLRLREKKIETILLVGVLTDICVMYTSADAASRGYKVVVISDATASSSNENHKFALQHMKEVQGITLLTTSEAMEILGSMN